MRVLIWVSKGFLEDLAQVATKDEKNVDRMMIMTETCAVAEAITGGKVDVVMIGASRLNEWRKIRDSGVVEAAPTFCSIYISALPLSDARMLEVNEAGICDVADLTMSRDEIGQRLVDGYKALRQRIPEHCDIVEKRINETVFLRVLSDPTDRQILLMIAQGKFDKEISAQLHLSLQTIRNRISRILNEVGARNRTHLALMVTGTPEEWVDDDSPSDLGDADLRSDDQVA